MSGRKAGTSLPPAIMHNAELENVVVGDGAVLDGCKVSNSVVGECVYVGRGTRVESSLLLGCSAWMSGSLRREALARGDRVYGVGEEPLRGGVLEGVPGGWGGWVGFWH